MSNILIIEDDKVTATLLTEGLSREGYRIHATDRPSLAREEIKNQHFDIILLDITLPEMSGFEFLAELRAWGYKGHIMMLTGLSALEDKIRALDNGADDYVTKPFEIPEVQARIRSVIRKKSNDAHFLRNGEIEMDLVSRQVVREGKKIDLTAREFCLMEFLMRNQEKVVDRNAIARQVWGSDFDPDSNVIDVYINHLRKKLDTPFNQKVLKTVVGQGYVLNRLS